MEIYICTNTVPLEMWTLFFLYCHICVWVQCLISWLEKMLQSFPDKQYTHTLGISVKGQILSDGFELLISYFQNVGFLLSYQTLYSSYYNVSSIVKGWIPLTEAVGLFEIKRVKLNEPCVLKGLSSSENWIRSCFTLWYNYNFIFLHDSLGVT